MRKSTWIVRLAIVSMILAVGSWCAVSQAQSAASAPASAPVASPAAEDWPRWAGPNGDCTSNEKGLLKEWPKDGLKVLWRGPIGIGSNHPSVAGDDLCYSQLDADQLHETFKCVDANSGKEKWHHTIKVPPIYQVGWGELGPRATATITDKYVYTVGTFGDGFCFDRKTGKIVWEHNFREDNSFFDPAPASGLKKGMALEWKGFNGSLIPVNGKIFYFLFQGGNPPIPAWTDAKENRKMQIVTLDAATGKVAWTFEEDCAKGNRGPGLITGVGMPIKFKGQDCIVFHGNRQWKILTQSEGKELWKWECSGPVDSPGWSCGGLGQVGKNLYMDALNGWQPSLLEVDFTQDDPKPKVIWNAKTLHAAITPCVILDGYVYGFTIEEKDRQKSWGMGAEPGQVPFSLTCTELKTGNVKWKEPGFFYGLSMSAADGMLYVRSHQTLRLVEVNAEKYVEKGKIENIHNLANTPGGMATHAGLLDWNIPAISQGRLFIRTPVEMIVYDIKAK